MDTSNTSEKMQAPNVDTDGLLALGLHIFPIPPGIKISGQYGYPGHTHASNDAEQILAWKNQYGVSNWGIEASRSGLIVVDIDNKPDKNLPIALTRATFEAVSAHHKDTVDYTPTALTPSGGQHIYFKLPSGFSVNSQSELADGIDIRAHNGYVVAPGSVLNTEKGVLVYKWSGNLYQAPHWLISHCQREVGALEAADLEKGVLLPAGLPMDVMPGHAKAFIAYQCSRLGETFEGGRNNLLNEICNNVMPYYHEAVIDPDLIAEMIRDAAHDSGLSEFETEATMRSGLGVGRSVADLQKRMSKDHPALVNALTVMSLYIAKAPGQKKKEVQERVMSPLFDEGLVPNDLVPDEGYMHGFSHPGMVTMLTGAPGTGKTSIMAMLACTSVCDQLDGGEKDGAWPINMSSMLYLGYEGMAMFRRTAMSLVTNRGWTQTHPERFNELKVNCRDQIIYEGVEGLSGRPVINKEFIGQIRAKIELMLPLAPQGRLTLVIDNILHSVANAVAQNYAKHFMDICQLFAQEYNISVVVLAHPPKGGDGIFGSYAFGAAADILHELHFEDAVGNERVNWMVPTKCRVSGPRICIKFNTRIPDNPVYEPDYTGMENRPLYRKAKLNEAKIAYVTTGEIDWDGPQPKKEQKAEIVKVASATTDKPADIVSVNGSLPAPGTMPPPPRIAIPPPPIISNKLSVKNKMKFDEVWNRK